MSAPASWSLSSYEPQVRARLAELAKTGAAERLWSRDASLWTSDPATQRSIGNRLGWLDAVEHARDQVRDLLAFSGEVRGAEFKHVLLLGMGGSSLCPEVLRRSFTPAPGHPTLAVLDSTHPASVLAAERAAPLGRTLFVVSTKSGTTTETLSFYRYFWQVAESARGQKAAPAFVAVTDPGTPLEHEAVQRGFRRVFPGPPSVGGRYSALTAFGLVPAALLGIDLQGWLGSARRMSERCRETGEGNPGLVLGAMLGELTLAERNKVTFLVDPRLASLGLWLEQLLAESLGKQGKGLVPLASEPLGAPEMYGDDRVFVPIWIGDPPAEVESLLATLASRGHPVIRRRLESALDLAGEFFVWEFATAIAGIVLGVNPFDEPNVSESKDNTRRVLEEFERRGRFESEPVWAEARGISVMGPPGASPPGRIASGEDGVVQLLSDWLGSLKPQGYLALQAYLPEEDAIEHRLQGVRRRARDRTRLATTFGFGPRFLHSTGQLHKGGPPIGAFLALTDESPAEVPVPGEPYGFATLIRAQAIGDAQSLAGRGLPMLRLHLAAGADVGAIEGWLERVGVAGAR